MNTTFHMTSNQAYSSLALTSHGTTLHVRIGFEHLEIPMGSTRALATAMQQLRREMIVTPDEIIQVCGDMRAGAETRTA
jgi:hypothetical protein